MLEAFERPNDRWGDIIIHLLQVEIQAAIKSEYSTKDPVLDVLLKFIKRKCQMLI